MNLKHPIRLSLLAVNLTVVLFVLGKSILDPNFAKGTPFDFPPEVSLPEWQFLENNPLKVNSKEGNVSSVFKAGRKYRYFQNNIPLDIEMRYVVRTQGQVEQFITQHPSIQSSPPQEISGKMRQQQGIGFYTVFVHQERAYLSSCINPYGGSTVTTEQFNHNRNTYDPQLSRLLPVLLGREDWRDYRCLWTYMSIPLKNSSSEEAYQTLEKVWISWYEWWSPRFPKP